jgi:hypothetical protein
LFDGGDIHAVQNEIQTVQVLGPKLEKLLKYGNGQGLGSQSLEINCSVDEKMRLKNYGEWRTNRPTKNIGIAATASKHPRVTTTTPTRTPARLHIIHQYCLHINFFFFSLT